VFLAVLSKQESEMQKAQTWRALLSIYVRDTKEKQRILDNLGVTNITLQRWINGETAPRPQNLRQLISFLPSAYRERMLTLLSEENIHTDVIATLQDNLPAPITTPFYLSILKALSSTIQHQRFWKLGEAIVDHALRQLDPENQGLYIWVALCMPPSGPFQKVRSLRESIGQATFPWPDQLTDTGHFLGAESLTGSVVTSCRPCVIQNISQVQHLLPIRLMDPPEKSVAIYPILYSGLVGGALIVGSVQTNYFMIQQRTDLIKNYADLIALAIESDAFYPSDMIALHVMPETDVQQKYFTAHFQRFRAQAMEDDHDGSIGLKFEVRPWQKLEALILADQSNQHIEEERQIYQ
jgi:hypothetical protein